MHSLPSLSTSQSLFRSEHRILLSVQCVCACVCMCVCVCVCVCVCMSVRVVVFPMSELFSLHKDSSSTAVGRK